MEARLVGGDDPRQQRTELGAPSGADQHYPGGLAGRFRGGRLLQRHVLDAAVQEPGSLQLDVRDRHLQSWIDAKKVA